MNPNQSLQKRSLIYLALGTLVPAFAILQGCATAPPPATKAEAAPAPAPAPAWKQGMGADMSNSKLAPLEIGRAHV